MKGSLALFSLVLCGFTFNLSEFMPAGILAEIAEGLGVTQSDVGLVISLYAWIVALLSVPLMIAVKNVEHKRLLLILMAGFTALNAIIFLSPNEQVFIICRLGTALLHCIFWAILVPMAAEAVEPERCNQAVAAVASAGAIAMVIGIPIGRAVAGSWGWSSAFLFVALLGLLGLMMSAYSVKRSESQIEISFVDAAGVIRNRTVLMILILTAVFMTGHNIAYSFLEGYLDSLPSIDALDISESLLVFGLAGLFSSFLFAVLYQKHPRTLIITAIILAAVSILAVPISGKFVIIVVCFIWGGSITMFNIIFQKEAMLSVERTYAPLATAMLSGTINLGIALGSLMGSVLVDMSGYTVLYLIGGCLVIVSLAYYFIAFRTFTYR